MAVYEVNVNYEETAVVVVEAKSAQEAEEMVQAMINNNNLDDFPDRETTNREWQVYADV